MAKLLESAPLKARAEVQQQLRFWRQNRDLAGVRDEGALARLPEEEREACRKLWAEVDRLLLRAGGPK